MTLTTNSNKYDVIIVGGGPAGHLRGPGVVARAWAAGARGREGR